jgi:hypothetical protein
MIVYIVEAEVHQLFLTIVDFKNMSVSMWVGFKPAQSSELVSVEKSLLGVGIS